MDRYEVIRAITYGGETYRPGDEVELPDDLAESFGPRWLSKVDSSEDVSEDTSEQQEEEPEQPEVDATDSAVELAQSEGVDLTEVEGTGKDGRVLKSDVEDYLK